MSYPRSSFSSTSSSAEALLPPSYSSPAQPSYQQAQKPQQKQKDYNAILAAMQNTIGITGQSARLPFVDLASDSRSFAAENVKQLPRQKQKQQQNRESAKALPKPGSEDAFLFLMQKYGAPGSGLAGRADRK